MTRHASWRSTSVPLDELDDWTRFARLHDQRLPDPASVLDVLRSVYRLAKITNAPVRQTDNVRSDNNSSITDGTILAERNTTTIPTPYNQQEIDAKLSLVAAGERVLDKRITLEKYRAETARWRSQASAFPYKIGSVDWNGDGPPRNTHRAEPENWYQGIHRICGHVHDLTEACPRGEP